MARHPLGAQAAEAGEHGAGVGVDADIDHAAGGALLGIFLCALGVEELVGGLAQAGEDIRAEDVCDEVEAVCDQLVKYLGGILQGHGELYRLAWRPSVVDRK